MTKVIEAKVFDLFMGIISNPLLMTPQPHPILVAIVTSFKSFVFGTWLQNEWHVSNMWLTCAIFRRGSASRGWYGQISQYFGWIFKVAEQCLVEHRIIGHSQAVGIHVRTKICLIRKPRGLTIRIAAKFALIQTNNPRQSRNNTPSARPAHWP